MRIAIIGSGISGLTAAWRLHEHHEITIFEKNPYFGGHTDTHQVQIDGQQLMVDTGFIVFNEQNYPLFCQMLKALNVEWQTSDMSFSVNNLTSNLVYNPSNLAALVLNAQNFLNPSFRRMFSDLKRFYKATRHIDVNTVPHTITLAQFLQENDYSDDFKHEHLYPMCGALWSANALEVPHLPLKFVLGFFQNHHMLQMTGRPTWLTVKGGSSTYINALKKQLKATWRMANVVSVDRASEEVQIVTATEKLSFDQVIFACHADQALKLLTQPSMVEKRVLGAFRYSHNTMVLHQDERVMPAKPFNWASWQVRVAAANDHPELASYPSYSFTYWMNTLQKLKTKTPVLATLNPNCDIDPQKILVTRHYEHPQFDIAALEAQSQWKTINGFNRSYFCGAYWGWGFHEDGAHSAHRVANYLRANNPEG